MIRVRAPAPIPLQRPNLRVTDSSTIPVTATINITASSSISVYPDRLFNGSLRDISLLTGCKTSFGKISVTRTRGLINEMVAVSVTRTRRAYETHVSAGSTAALAQSHPNWSPHPELHRAGFH